MQRKLSKENYEELAKKTIKESIKFAKALASENSIHHILVKDLETNHKFRGDF